MNVQPGDDIPSWDMPRVTRERMRTMQEEMPLRPRQQPGPGRSRA